MDAQIESIVYSSAINNLTSVNDSFDRGIIRVAYHGKNRNGSNISKEAFERSMPTIYGVPVVCNYDRETDSIGSHDMEVVRKDGDLKLVNLTTPVGFIPPQAEYGWEEVVEDNGTVHEYLWVEAILWKRQEAYEKIKNNIITDESMEIRVKDRKMVDGCYHIDSFEFTAFCLLESADPCFESACLQVFAQQDIAKRFAEMMDDFKFSLLQVTPSLEDDINSYNENLSKGGEFQMSITEILEKYGLTAEELDFEFDGLTAEEFESKVAHFVDMKKGAADDDGEDDEQVVGQNIDDEPMLTSLEPEDGDGEDGDEPDGDQDPTAFSLTATQLREEIYTALDAYTFEHDLFGMIPRYSYCDHTDAEVIAFDNNDWNMYGLPYAMNGDHVVMDFECAKRKKIVYADFEDGVDEATAFAHASTMFHSAVEAKMCECKKSVQEEFDAKAIDMQNVIDELTAYRMSREEEDMQAQAEAKFAEFSDLNGIEAFDKLKNDHSDMSIEDIENKCFELRGRFGKFAMSKQSGVRTPGGEKPAQKKEPYGDLFAKYPPSGK